MRLPLGLKRQLHRVRQRSYRDPAKTVTCKKMRGLIALQKKILFDDRVPTIVQSETAALPGFAIRRPTLPAHEHGSVCESGTERIEQQQLPGLYTAVANGFVQNRWNCGGRCIPVAVYID